MRTVGVAAGSAAVAGPTAATLSRPTGISGPSLPEAHDVEEPAENEAPNPEILDAEETEHYRALESRIEANTQETVTLAELGGAPNSMVPIDGQIQQAARNGQVVDLPPGEYVLNDTVSTAASGWGIRGTGDSPRDVVIRGSGKMLLVDQRGGENVIIENLTMDNGSSGDAGVGMRFNVTRSLRIRNVHHIGLSPRQGSNGTRQQYDHQESSLTVNVHSPDGVAVIENFVKRSPTEIGGHRQNDATFASWSQHRGLVYVRNSEVQNAGGDGATYISRTNGGWRFSGCLFQNCHANSLRLGGGRSWARNCTIAVDIITSRQVNQVKASGKAAMNPIVWEGGTSRHFRAQNSVGGLVDGCRIVMHNVEGCRGGITVDGSHGGVVIRNTTIVNHTDAPCINLEASDGSHMNNNLAPPRPHPCWIENVLIDGTGSGVAIDDNRNSSGANVCIRNGMEVRGFPESALGCASDGGNVQPPAHVANLISGLGGPHAVNASGAPAATLPAARGPSASGTIAAAVGNFVSSVATLFIYGLLFVFAGIGGLIWLFKRFISD